MFGLTAAVTGISETAAKEAGLDADSVVLSPMSHAGYYPGGKVMTMKVVFERGTYRLLGAQIMGLRGGGQAHRRACHRPPGGLKATELKDLDLAYAPPYSSAKDPVNMAGFMIENIAHGILKQWHLADADTLPPGGSVTLLDVRTTGEFARGHIDGFVNIPVDELRERLASWTGASRCMSSVRAACAAISPAASWPETALTATTSPAASASTTR